ncbi:MAG TPA: helix-turn-helix transcriptional regulator [Candidatus Tectomicrobia bacterium]
MEAQRKRNQSLGQLLHHARTAKGLSLREAALWLRGAAGRPISYTHLQAIEKDRRCPSLPLLCAMAHTYDLDMTVLLLHAKKIPDLVHTYLQAVPAGAGPLLELLLWAYHLRFGAWHLLLSRLLETARGQGPCPSLQQPSTMQAGDFSPYLRVSPIGPPVACPENRALASSSLKTPSAESM